MKLLDLSLAIDALKDRMCAIEQNTFEEQQEEVKKAQQKIATLVKNAELVYGAILRTEGEYQ